MGENGGALERLLDRQARTRMLPNGSAILFDEHDNIWLRKLSTGREDELARGGIGPRYVPTGHILYVHVDGGLVALPFDLATLEVTGSPVQLSSDVTLINSFPPFDVSDDGTRLMAVGAPPDAATQHLLVIDPIDASFDTLAPEPRTYGRLRFAHDGRRVAFNTGESRSLGRELFTYDLSQGTLTQITFEGGAHAAVWSPDDTRLVFSQQGEGSDAEDLYTTSSAGGHGSTRLLSLPQDQHAADWPADNVMVLQGPGVLPTIDPTADC